MKQLIGAVALLAASAGAAAAPDHLKLENRLDTTLSTSVWSGTRNLDGTGALVYPQVQAKFSQTTNTGFGIVVEGYAGHAKPFDGHSAKDTAGLREAYVNIKAGDLSLRAGSQIISWGRADVFNPTDNVSAQNYTLLVADDAAQKKGILTASLTWRLGNTAVQGVWQPAFRASTLPLPTTPGFRYEEHAPEGLPTGRGGLRIDTVSERLSWSLSYFHGPAKRPNLAISPTRAARGVIDLNHPNVSVYGVDGEYVAGRWIIRGEAAYQRFAGSGSDALASRESFTEGVLGVERNLGNFSVFVQGTYRRGFDHINARSITGNAGVLALANATVNEEVYRSLPGVGAGLRYATPDLRWVSSLETAWHPGIGDVAIRPRLRYQWNDTFAIWGGADYFAGRSDGPFGRLADNTVLFWGLSQNLSVSQ